VLSEITQADSRIIGCSYLDCPTLISVTFRESEHGNRATHETRITFAILLPVVEGRNRVAKKERVKAKADSVRGENGLGHDAITS
jgi:hypothetical protein